VIDFAQVFTHLLNQNEMQITGCIYNKCSVSINSNNIRQTWIQYLLIQDQDQHQDFDVQDQDRDSRLTRPILEVHDWDGL